MQFLSSTSPSQPQAQVSQHNYRRLFLHPDCSKPALSSQQATLNTPCPQIMQFKLDLPSRLQSTCSLPGTTVPKTKKSFAKQPGKKSFTRRESSCVVSLLTW